MIRHVLLLILLFGSAVSAFPENALVSGGKSPDGKYALRIYESDQREPSNYLYALVDAKTGRIIKSFHEGGGGYLYEGARDNAIAAWSPDSRTLALFDPAKHDMEMYLYEIPPEGAVLLHVPNYKRRALSRVGATQIYLVCITRPTSWKGDVLTCKFIFDAATQEGRSGIYSVLFSLRVHHGETGAASVSLQDMGRPTSSDN